MRKLILLLTLSLSVLLASGQKDDFLSRFYVLLETPVNKADKAIYSMFGCEPIKKNYVDVVKWSARYSGTKLFEFIEFLSFDGKTIDAVAINVNEDMLNVAYTLLFLDAVYPFQGVYVYEKKMDVFVFQKDDKHLFGFVRHKDERFVKYD